MTKTIQKLYIKKLSILFSMLLLGMIYLFAIKVNISEISTSSKTFDFIINSTINQEVNFHIKTEHNLSKLICNKKSVLLDNSKKHDYFYRGDEAIKISLNRGENRCQAIDMKPVIKQKIGFIDFFILFLLWGIPFFHLLFICFIWIVDKIKKNRSNSSKIGVNKPSSMEKSPLTKWIMIILLTGVIIRIAYFQKYGIMLFQHDWHGHIEFIKYIATNWNLPTIPMKGLEYPQQPLYYILTAGLYAVFIDFGFSDQEALHGLGYFSLFCSIVFLYFSYRLIEILNSDKWIQIVVMIFISLTPSLVYLSARINNDSLVMALSVVSIYYIVKSYQDDFKSGFYIALISVSLLFLTKVSAGGVELLLFILLLIVYFQSKKDEESRLRKQLYIYSLTGTLLLCLLLLRVYMPLDDGFYMVNSAKFPKQTIEHLDFNYFSSFNILNLISTGQSHVFGEDSIRYSFLTYQYGTMFFGEADCSYFTDKSEYLHLIMQIILTLGLIYIVGLIVYLVNLYREPLLNKILFFVLLINLFLILKFIVMYPSICNTDFRYFVGSFTIWAFVFARGLRYIAFNKTLERIVGGILGLLVASELLFFWFLI